MAEAPIAGVDVSAAARVKPARPVIPARTFNLADFGAVGDGQTMNTAAFKKAVAAVNQAGGGKLVVPKGVFITGPFELCSSLDFHLDAGAMVQAPATFEALGLPDPSTLKTQAEASAVKIGPLISGRGLHDLAITGPGTIDGNGSHWWAWSERAERAHRGRLIYSRPHILVINDCSRLLVADITLSNSSKYHLVAAGITDLTVERVKVRAPWDGSGPNTDGIDIGPGTNFLVRDCDVDTGDDDICIKSGGTNVLIENNTIKHGHGISIGSGTVNGVNNMLVRHNTFDGADNGIRIKSMRGAGGLVQNVRYTDIQMKHVANPIILQLDYVDNNRPNFKGDPAKVPAIHNILLDHLTIEGSRNAGLIHGIPDSPITNITLQDITITAEKDFDVRDADNPTYTRVTKTIKPGVGPVRGAPGEH